MRGTIQKRIGPRGTVYRLRVFTGIDPADGKRKWLSERVKGSRKAAERRLRELVTEVESGLHVAPTDLTVAGLLDRWLGTVQASIRPTTAEGYEWYCEAYLKPHLGSYPVQKLTPEQVQATYAALLECGGKQVRDPDAPDNPEALRGRPLSRRTVYHAHRTLDQALKYALRANLIARNPCDVVTAPRFDRREIRVLEPREAAAVFTYLRERTLWAFWPAALALLTGARRSEVLALTWPDVNLNGGAPSLSVRRGFTRLASGEEIVRPPKTGKARNVSLGPRAVALLQEWRAEREKEARLLEQPVQEWLFSDPLGRPYKPSSVSQAFRRACRAAGVDGASFHSLRHTHATGMLRANVHPAVVQQRLGHSTISTTIDLYSHVAPSLQARAAERFDEAFGDSLPALSEPSADVDRVDG